MLHFRRRVALSSALALTLPRWAFVAAIASVLAAGPAWASGAAPGEAGSDLPRRAMIGAGFGPTPAGGALVNLVRPESAALLAGLQVNDRVVEIDGTPVASPADLGPLLKRIAGRAVPVRVQRGDAEVVVTLTAPPAPSEQLEHSTVTYSFVTATSPSVPGPFRLRTIITEPLAASAAGITEPRATGAGDTTEPKEGAGAARVRRPAFLFIQGIPCASLDRPTMPEAVDTRLVHAIAEAGFVTLRVDKPGLGDSEGPPCADIDFQTELAGYRAALAQLRSLASVDPERVYVFGHSMGGVMAPYLMAPGDDGEAPVRGAIVYGTMARTWLEYVLENIRRQYPLMGASQAQTTAAMESMIALWTGVLMEGRTVAQVLESTPALRVMDPSLEPERVYGRHLTFFRELQALNLAQAWSEARGHVLALHGEHDFVAPELDHRMIADIVNAADVGAGRTTDGPLARGVMRTLPRADHAFTVHPSLQSAVRANGRGEWDGALPAAVLAWIAEVEAAPSQAR